MSSPIPKRTCLQVQQNVLFALFLRELKTRFGLFRLGYFWAIAEPVSMIAILSAIRLAFGSKDLSGVPFPLFFASGIIPFFFFQSCVNQCLQAVESNIPLMNYKVVSPSDNIISRWLLELSIYGLTGLIIICGLVYLNFTFRWNNTLGLISTLGCLGLFSLGIAFLVGVVAPLFHESKKIIPIVMRPLFFVSGIFFAADTLPPKIRDIMLWNPLLHVSELIRTFMFLDYQSHEGNLGYLFLCSLISLFIGLSIYRLNRIRLVTSGQIR